MILFEDSFDVSDGRERMLNHNRLWSSDSWVRYWSDSVAYCTLHSGENPRTPHKKQPAADDVMTAVWQATVPYFMGCLLWWNLASQAAWAGRCTHTIYCLGTANSGALRPWRDPHWTGCSGWSCPRLTGCRAWFVKPAAWSDLYHRAGWTGCGDTGMARACL